MLTDVAPKPDFSLVGGIVTPTVVTTLTPTSGAGTKKGTGAPVEMSTSSKRLTPLTGTASVPVPAINHLGTLIMPVSASVGIGATPLPPLLPSGRSGAPSIGLDILLNVSPGLS